MRLVIECRNIIRGTSHIISSYAEDIFAKYVSDLISNKYEVWIDPQITIRSLKNKSKKKPLLFRPDVCIVEKKTKVVVGIFDLKMDLGYKRNEFVQQVMAHVDKLEIIKKQKATCRLNQDPNIEISFSEKLIWNYVVISKGNISDDKYSKVEDYFKKENRAQLFTLTTGEHLNTYKDSFVPEINEGDFKKLKKNIKNISH